MSETTNAAHPTSQSRRGQPNRPHAESQNMNPDTQAPENRPGGRKRRHRRPRRHRHRRPSFAVPPSPISDHDEHDLPKSPEPFPASQPTDIPKHTATSPQDTRRPSLYNLTRLGRDLSGTSFDSQELLDHRNQPRIRTRRESRLDQSSRPEFPSSYQQHSHPSNRGRPSAASDEDESDNADDRTPLIKPSSVRYSNFVRYGTDAGISQSPQALSPHSSSLRAPRYDIDALWGGKRDYDVNNPPSIPGSPSMGPEMAYGDALVTGHEFDQSRSPAARSVSSHPRDAVIDIEERERQLDDYHDVSPSSPGLVRRRTVTLPVEEDVCFPTGGLSDLAEEDFVSQTAPEAETESRRRRRRRVWPDLSVLEEWSREEKEERSGGNRAKTVSEPVLIGGRLRTRNAAWKFEEEDAPYRFTYFNEELPSTIHSQTISELVQPGQTFRHLFIPDPPELESDSSDDEDEECDWNCRANSTSTYTTTINNTNNGRHFSRHSDSTAPGRGSGEVNFDLPNRKPKEKRYGPRPTFWLDVLCPTDTEMRVLAKAFGIHALTVEDIMMQEAREKVELFRQYYFINYRTFEQDANSPNFLEPVNMYVVVFREGLLSFHFSMTPHPANVRRRIRQLKDYLILSADWISYAIIDDITDVFGPLIQAIEDEVDQIDDTILRLHSDPKDLVPKVSKEDETGQALDSAPSGSDMLRRVGECRKKVMGLYRLLGNKADVIKGFAKRCNEHWEVAPKSEIGLYLGDIQDHILTMTSNLTHYETLLSRAHSNYLALINIRMNERQEQTADVLGKLTVLGTIVLPMNIICGMWGMNVKVPGQDEENLYWFWSITAGLVGFAVCCFYVAKRVYGIV